MQPGTADDALFVAQSMPWIDPLKEANAWQVLVETNQASEVEAIRRRGANPRDVLEQRAEFRRTADELGIPLTAAAADRQAAAEPQPAEPPAPPGPPPR